MRYSTTTLVVAALSIGQTMAGPTHAHLHRHRNVHEKKDVDWNDLDWANMGIDWSSAWAAGQHKSTAAPAPVVTPTPSPAVLAEVPAKSTATPAAAPVSSSSNDLVSDVEAGVATLWNGLKGLANDITSFGTAVANTGSEVGATGNIGSPQGHNMIKVASASGYPFTNTFINTSKQAMTIVIWNKAYSRDGSPANADPNLGSCVAPETPTLTFALAPGGKQVVAFQDGSLVGWSEAVDKRTPAGAFDITWGEGSFKSVANGQSGYDMSSIVNSGGNNYQMAISSAEVSCVSDPTQNYWEAKDGNPLTPVPIGSSDGSCFVPGNSATLVTKMGGYM